MPPSVPPPPFAPPQNPDWTLFNWDPETSFGVAEASVERERLPDFTPLPRYTQWQHFEFPENASRRAFPEVNPLLLGTRIRAYGRDLNVFNHFEARPALQMPDIYRLIASSPAAFKLVDANQTGIRGKQAELRFIHTPAYLPGFTTRADRSCWTTSSCVLSLNNGEVVTVADHGFTQALSTSEPFIHYPFEPFATQIVIETNGVGIGSFGAAVHKGHPGLYGASLQIDGIRSAPFFFYVDSKLVTIQIVQQPAGATRLYHTSNFAPIQPVNYRTVRVIDTMNLCDCGLLEDAEFVRPHHLCRKTGREIRFVRAGNASLPSCSNVTMDDGSTIWDVGTTLHQYPVLRLLDAQGDPLYGYQVTARAVNATTREPLKELATFDLYDGKGTSYEGLYNPLGSARSNPSNASGHADMDSLMLTDAADGVQFRVEFFFKPTSSYEDQMLQRMGAQPSPEVTALSERVFTARNRKAFEVETEPSETVALGSDLPVPPTVRVETPMVPYRFRRPCVNLGYLSKDQMPDPGCMRKYMMIREGDITPCGGTTLNLTQAQYLHLSPTDWMNHPIPAREDGVCESGCPKATGCTPINPDWMHSSRQLKCFERFTARALGAVVKNTARAAANDFVGDMTMRVVSRSAAEPSGQLTQNVRDYIDSLVRQFIGKFAKVPTDAELQRMAANARQRFDMLINAAKTVAEELIIGMVAHRVEDIRPRVDWFGERVTGLRNPSLEERPILQYCPGSEVRYFKPMVARLGLNVLRLTPSKTNEGTVPLAEQGALGDALLNNHQCITQAGSSLLGGCTGLGGEVAGGHRITGSDCPSFYPSDGDCYGANDRDVPPVYSETFRLDQLQWQNHLPGVRELRLVPGSMATLLEAQRKGVARPEQLPTIQAFQNIEISDTPSTIFVSTIPPRVVQVGVPFVMKCIVRISSGALLANAVVTVELAPATGALLSAVDFIKTQFGLIDPMVSDDPPKLDAETASAVTDSNGVARLVIVIERGPPTEERKLIFKTGDIESKTTRVLQILNPVSYVAPTRGINYERTHLNAIGSTFTHKVRVQGMSPETFPVLLRLPDTEVHVRSATLNGRTASPRALSAAFELRTFSTADLDKMRRKRRDAEEAMGGLVQEADAFRNSQTGQAVAAGGEDAYTIALTSDTPMQALSEFTPPVNASAFKDYARQNGRAVLDQFVKLIMSGTNPMTTDPSGASSTAAIWASEDIWAGSGDIGGQDDVEDADAASLPVPAFTIVPSFTSGSTINDANATIALRITNLRIVIRAPGTYKLQPIVMGIAGNFLDGQIRIEKYDKNDPAAIALEYAFRIIATAMVAAMALGASDFHRAIVFIPLSLMWITGLGLLLLLEDGPIDYPIGEYYEMGTWWVVCLALIAWFTLTGALGLCFPMIATRFPMLMPFAVKRRNAYFAYCKALVKRPSTEVGKMKAMLKRAEASSDMTLAQKMQLEQQISIAQFNERDYFRTIKHIAIGMTGYGEAAFFYPQRMYGAFVISAFGVAFMCVGVWRWCNSYRDSLERMDTRATQAMYSMVRVLQEQFLSRTGEDLPADATDWVTDNAFELHGHIVSLGESLLNGIIGGMIIGYAFFLAAWAFHFLEFRQQVLLARRGDWDFDWRQVSTAMVVTFVGTTVSNGLFSFIFTQILFTPIVIILSWSVTWEYVKSALGNTTMLIILIVIPLTHIAIKFAVRTVIFSDYHTIRYRYMFMAYELYEVLVTCVAGIAKSVIRLILVILTTLLTLPRLDRSPFPAWLEYYFLLDSGSKSFQGMIKLYHWHNHPVMRVTAWIIQEDALERKRGNWASPKVRQISNRWWKLWMMHKNPGLCIYSSRGKGQPEMKIEAKGEVKGKAEVKETAGQAAFNMLSKMTGSVNTSMVKVKVRDRSKEAAATSSTASSDE